MKIINLKELEKFDTSKNRPTPQKLIVQDEVTVVYLCFESGQDLPPHITPVDVYFHVVKGKGKILVGEEEVEVEEGNIVLSPKNIPHALKNDSDGVFNVLVVKTPTP